MELENLDERIKQEIKDRKFSALEITGFKSDPNLALIAGAAIGYKLGVDDLKRLIEDCND